MLERDIEAAIVRYAKSRGVLVYKFSSPSHCGVCDRILIAPGGIVWFLELKRSGEEPTPLQHKFLNDVAAQGANSSWVDSIAAGRSLIDSLALLS